MRDANGGTKMTFGVVENLDIQINGISILVHAWIIEDPPYRLLLGRPFQLAASADTEDTGDILIIMDPDHPGHCLRIPMRLHSNPHLPCSHFLAMDREGTEGAYQVNSVLTSGTNDTVKIPHLSSVVSPLSRNYWALTYDYHVLALGLRYKPVDRKIRPVATTLPEAARPKCWFPEDPLKSLPFMSTNPVQIATYGWRLTKDWWEALKLAENGFLWDEEIKLAFEVLKNNEEALAWDDSEKGRFRDDYFDPIVIPTIEHEPWALRNIPIPHGLCFGTRETIGVRDEHLITKQF